MKVLIHSLIFSPDGVSTAYLYNDIASAFKDNGYEVVVLTTTPHFNIVKPALEKQPLRWKIPGILKQSYYNGIKVFHIPQKKFKNPFLRIIGFAYWHIISFFVSLFIRHIDIIISPSPPLTIGLLNAWIGKIKRCKIVYNVQEIYPDILNLKDGLIKSSLEKLERYVYHKSDRVTTIDQVFFDIIAPRMDKKDKLQIIPNFVDTELYRPLSRDQINLPTDLFPPTNSIKLLYAGNIGYAQDWDPLINLAINTKNCDIEYFVIGEGVMKGYIEKAKSVHCLTNMHILPYQKRELMPQIIAYSDIQFIFMHPNMDKQGFPSKVYTIMACGKPLLVCSGKDTPIVNFLNDIGCSKIIPEADSSLKVKEMIDWLRTIKKEELVTMGERGFDIIKNNYTKDIVAHKYVQLANMLLNK